MCSSTKQMVYAHFKGITDYMEAITTGHTTGSDALGLSLQHLNTKPQVVKKFTWPYDDY